ncbi:MAG: hypothetical protein JWM28_1977 [Chitinophagaceae bacterium]|nr:hypothetical protein [Chitinophagaceae bacterium]
MKAIVSCLLSLLIFSCANGKDRTFIASTPAASLVRSFLGIPLADSIDFIRWKLILNDNQYILNCHYGISKPNSNGFIDGGNKIELTGELKKEKNYLRLKSGNKTLMMVELNTDLLHVLNADNSLLIGNGGWSYTLNNITPSVSDQINVTAKQTGLRDSMGFEGRTPCGVPGIMAPGALCYKLKWYIVLYANAVKNEPGTYKVYGTPYRKEGGRKGNWKIMRRKNGEVIYQLNDDKGNGFLYLLKADEHILLFTDAQGKLLVGDEDFSYTLNSSW